MTSAVQLPFRHGAPTKVGKRIYRKQVLPLGHIDYKGRKIDFTPEYLADLAKSFNDGAYDQVAFMLAPDDNSHTLDPERFRGEVKGLELSADGLDMLVEMTEDGAAVVDKNPRLGVSARIVEDMSRADGKHFPRAIQHVLGTLDPRVTGMKPWTSVDLTNDIPVVDLTAATYQGEGTMPELTDEELTAFRTFLADQKTATPTPEEVAAAAKAEQDQLDAALEAKVNEALEAAATGDGGEVDPALVGASLSADQQASIDLANSKAEAASQGHAALRAELDAERFEHDQATYVAAGVPPVLVELAKPLLIGSGHVVELSNSETVDAGDTIRKILDECKGYVDLSAETPSMLKPTDEEADILDRFGKQFPTK